MRNVRTIEDGYEWRVKRIFIELQEKYADRIGMEKLTFEEWLDKDHKTVADAFLSDVETYMGIPEADGD